MGSVIAKFSGVGKKEELIKNLQLRVDIATRSCWRLRDATHGEVNAKHDRPRDRNPDYFWIEFEMVGKRRELEKLRDDFKFKMKIL